MSETTNHISERTTDYVHPETDECVVINKAKVQEIIAALSDDEIHLVFELHSLLEDDKFEADYHAQEKVLVEAVASLQRENEELMKENEELEEMRDRMQAICS